MKEVHSKGSVWYNSEHNIIAVQNSYEPIINELIIAEPVLSKIGVIFHKVLVHDFGLLDWEWIGML